MTFDRDVLIDYLMGNLTALEEREVAVYLTEHPDEAAWVRDLFEVMAELALAQEPAETPAGGEALLLARIRRRPQPAQVPSEVIRLPKSRRRFTGLTQPAYRWLLAACIALAVTGGSLFWGYRNYGAYHQARAETQLLTAFLAHPQVQKVALENVIGSDRLESPGSVLLTPGGEALFVLADAAPPGRAYQAWGHASSDWNPERGEELTSLLVSQGNVFEVSSSGFASLYLSLEPSGGSPQPTNPLTKVSLLNPVSDVPVEITSPADGASISTNSIIVTGVVDSSITGLSYALNGGEAAQTTFANNRFSFTVSDLEQGRNILEVAAEDVHGATRTDTVTVVYAPTGD